MDVSLPTRVLSSLTKREGHSYRSGVWDFFYQKWV